MIEIDNRDPRPIYEQVKDALSRLIVSGGIRADERLPSVREMASSLAINPNTIQRAYRELEAEGYIYTVAGKGAFAASQEQTRDVYLAAIYDKYDALVRQLKDLGEGMETLTDRMERIYKEREEDGT